MRGIPAIRWLLGELLWRANASREPTMYEIKDRLLERWGTREPEDDCQHLVRECWGWSRVCLGASCLKCGGTGIYSERLVRLERWRLGRRGFHRPWRDGLPIYPYTRPVIEGYLRRRIRWSHEATLWLYLLFDRRRWWWEMTLSCTYGPGTRTPMLLLNRALFHGRIWLLNRGWRVQSAARRLLGFHPKYDSVGDREPPF